MSTTVSQMTVSELRDLIATVIDEKLGELIDEAGLEIDDRLRERLVAQKGRVEEGDRGVAMDDVLNDLGLS